MTYKKDIPLAGLSTSPSDYDCEDGQLADAMNVIHRDGAIATSSVPSVLMNTGSDVIIYQHQNTGLYHLIGKRTTDYTASTGVTSKPSYFWVDASYDGKEYDVDASNVGAFPELNNIEVKNVISIGNTLIFYSADSTYYYKYKIGVGYNFMGTHIPEIKISFGLQANHPVIRKTETINGQSFAGIARAYGDESTAELNGWAYTEHIDLDYPSDLVNIRQENQNAITTAVLGSVNKFVSKQHDKGRFVHPFIIRYAYRLYDGSVTMHSCPVLMLTSSGVNPMCVVDGVCHTLGDDTHYEFLFHTEGLSFDLDYKVENDISESLSMWGDIIRSVDIFVSAPLYSYDPDGKIEHLLGGYDFAPQEDGSVNVNDDFIEKASISPYYSRLSDYATICKAGVWNPTQYVADSVRDAMFKSSNIPFGFLSTINGDLRLFTSNGLAGPPAVAVELPVKSEETRKREIEECSTFYLLKSILIDQLSTTERSIISIDKGYLNSLVSRDVMTDDYFSHDMLIPEHVSQYNNRLTYGNIKRRVNMLPDIGIMVAHQDAASPVSTTTKVISDEESGRLVVVSQTYSAKPVSDLYIPYLCYPNPNAKMLQFRQDSMATGKSCTYVMKEHVGLNAAYYFGGFSKSIEKQYADSETPSSDSFVISHREIQTSDVNNPFVFRAANVEQIGNGSIIAMMPAAQALSTGQFGEFPMYAFTTDGVWALSVSSTGGWSAKQPVSRDVALSKDSILQLDQEVMFATKRGLMIISGSKIQCMSEMFDGCQNRMASMFSQIVCQNLGISSFSESPDFKSFIADCNMHYDYTGQRIIIGNKDHKFCYVYNAKDQLWTAMPIQLTSAIPSYPNALAMQKVGNVNKLVDLSVAAQTSEAGVGIILTRPIKLDRPDELKTISTIVAHGQFSQNYKAVSSTSMTPAHTDIILFASRDLDHWLTIGSTRGNRLTLRHGSPYKYFRVALITHLEAGESISAITIEYEQKQTNKIR